MKFLCPHCERLAEPAHFALDGGALVLTCARCGADARAEPAGLGPTTSSPTPAPAAPPSPAAAHRAPVGLVSAPGASNVISLRTSTTAAAQDAARQSAEGRAFAIPEGACPKCLAQRTGGADSCGQCGLVFALANQAALAPPEWLATAWVALLDDWSQEPAHERLRKEAMLRESLIPLARLYRLRLAWMPEDPVAQRGRDELLKLAASPVSFTAGAGPDGGGTATSRLGLGVAVLALFSLVALVGLLYQLIRSWGP